MMNMPLYRTGAWSFPLPKSRYGGTGIEWNFHRLAEPDQAAIRVLYENLDSLMQLPVWENPSAEERRNVLIDWKKKHNWRRCWRDMAALGPESYIKFGSEMALRQVIHDLRGGPLTALVLALSSIDHDTTLDTDFNYIRLMARDVRKIARNCFPNLDPISYEKDRLDAKHATTLIVDKWSRSRGRGGVSVISEYRGDIAQSCVEFSALDRVLYNLMNNAIREAEHTDEAVELRIMTNTETSEAKIARFWITNPIEAQHRTNLIKAFHEDLRELFLTNYSTTGSGLGMQIAANFVAKAFGVSTSRALESKMVGAIISQNHFHTYFHWPVADA